MGEKSPSSVTHRLTLLSLQPTGKALPPPLKGQTGVEADLVTSFCCCWWLVGCVDESVRGERGSAEINGDLLRLNLTSPASAGPLSRVVIGQNSKKADDIEK